MKYFLITILLMVPGWLISSLTPDSHDGELIGMYDQIISEFDDVLSMASSVAIVSVEDKVKIDEDVKKNTPEILEKEIEIPEKVLLDVDFTSQAPFRDWSYPWQEFCEEAAVLMTMRYFDGRGIADKNDANDALHEIMKWEEENLGFYKDTTATTTMKIITDFYEYKKVKLTNDISVNRIREELARRNLIILPTAGRILENPYFTPPGPIYHNLVLIGYDDQEEIFYTNDPGIMSGNSFKYSYQNIIDSVADWSYELGTINPGRRVMIIVKK
jgi:hypothetical protein